MCTTKISAAMTDPNRKDSMATRLIVLAALILAVAATSIAPAQARTACIGCAVNAKGPDYGDPWEPDPLNPPFVEPISPCELGIGGDGCTIGEGGVGMPGVEDDLEPGGWFIFDGYTDDPPWSDWYQGALYDGGEG